MAGKNAVECLGPSYRLDDRKAAIQSAINLYLEQSEGLGESRPLTLVSIPGLVQIANPGAEIRGMRNVNGRWFVVAGSVLYEASVDGGLTSRGALASASGAVSLSHNMTQLCLVDGANGYVLTLDSNTFAQIVSDGWRGSNDVFELDGYGVFVAPGTDQLYLSAIDDFSTFNALDFSSADSQPDGIVTHRVLHREIWFMGDVSCEIWVNSGDAAFPFVRYNSVTLDVGVVGRQAATLAADTLFWVGKTQRGSGLVYRAVGHQPQRISTRAVEQALAKSSDIRQATMWVYQVDGHEFIGLNAPGLETTWVFDAKTEQWHERGEWLAGWRPYRVNHVCAIGSTQYAGDSAGKLYRIDPAAYYHAGDPLVRERTWPHLITPGMEPVSYRSMEIACSSGHGGSVTLEISNNGGFTFGPMLIRSLGAVGQFMQRIRWLPLGSAIDRVFRIRCSDAVPFNIHAASIET